MSDAPRSNLDPSRSAKWLLLVSSLVVMVLMAGSGVREFFSEWRVHQREYRRVLLANADDKASRISAATYRAALQQIVVPELGVSDRCVSCHTGIEDPRMSEERQPFRTHPGTILRDHPSGKFGCTVCHRGQGLATTHKDSKAVHSFWDYPMLPGKMVQASCGQCHDPQWLEGNGGKILARGARIFEERGCRSCHKLGGRGGSLGMALDDEGRRVIHQFTLTGLKGEHTVWNWLEEHFRDPAGVVPGSQMRNPTLSEPESEALTTFVLSLSTATLPNEYIAPDKLSQRYSALQPGKPNGARLYKRFCYSCHESGSFGRWDKTFKRFVPAVRGEGLAASSPDYLRQQISSGREGTLMPAWNSDAGGLSDVEIAALVSYIRAGRQPAPTITTRNASGNSRRGQALYAQNCQGCHGSGGKNGTAPTLASGVFRETATDEFLLAVIKNGRPDTAMPAFQQAGRAGLNDTELADVVAYIRALR